MDLSRTFTQINGDFRRKSQIFPAPLYFAPPLKGFPLELGIGARGQKSRIMGYQIERKVEQMNKKPSGYNTPTWRTERRTNVHQATAKTALTHSVAR